MPSRRQGKLIAVVLCATASIFMLSHFGTAFEGANAPTSIILSGGRLFSCPERSTSGSPQCLTAALNSIDAEARRWRQLAGKLSCQYKKTGPTGGFCLSESKKSEGSNDAFERAVANGLCDAMGGHGAVLDLGCGVGQYSAALTACGLSWRGYDGADNVEEVTNGLVKWVDVTTPLDLGPSDWVLSLEVGEHLPADLAAAFVDNLARHARTGILLSWAVPGQVGHNHINNKPNEWVIEELRKRGFRYDEGASTKIREGSQLFWFKDTIMMFRRSSGAPSAHGSVRALRVL